MAVTNLCCSGLGEVDRSQVAASVTMLNTNSIQHASVLYLSTQSELHLKLKIDLRRKPLSVHSSYDATVLFHHSELFMS